MAKLTFDILGWLGAAVFLTAYLLVSLKKLAGDAIPFQALNILGGLLLVANSAYYHVWPSVAVNVAWAGVGLFVLVRRAVRPG